MLPFDAVFPGIGPDRNAISAYQHQGWRYRYLRESVI